MRRDNSRFSDTGTLTAAGTRTGTVILPAPDRNPAGHTSFARRILTHGVLPFSDRVVRCLAFRCLFVCFLCCCLVLFSQPAFPLELGRNLPTSARDMEFFYRHQRMDAVAGILKALDAGNRLQNGELRLITAAFLAELFKKDPTVADRLLTAVQPMSAYAKRTLLWAVHLSGSTHLAASAKGLATEGDTTLLQQIAKKPRNLLQWNPLSGRSVVFMYFGAFFACEDARYIDALLGCVSLYARLAAQGLVHDPRYDSTQFVAAMLYEMTPRHACIARRIKEKIGHVPEKEAKILSTILNAKPN